MRLYPGNNMSYREIYDMVQACPEDCQKFRVTLPGDRKTPIERVIVHNLAGEPDHGHTTARPPPDWFSAEFADIRPRDAGSWK